MSYSNPTTPILTHAMCNGICICVDVSYKCHQWIFKYICVSNEVLSLYLFHTAIMSSVFGCDWCVVVAIRVSFFRSLSAYKYRLFFTFLFFVYFECKKRRGISAITTIVVWMWRSCMQQKCHHNYFFFYFDIERVQGIKAHTHTVHIATECICICIMYTFMFIFMRFILDKKWTVLCEYSTQFFLTVFVLWLWFI